MDVTNLSGKTVVVTGAGSGIGKETALAFARRGASLALCDVNESGLEETTQQARALGCEVLARRVDVANRNEMSDFAAAVHQQVAAADIVMNNAGVGLAASFLDTSPADWDWVLGINLCGVVYGCHFFIPPMVARRQGGHIINVASSAAFVATSALAAYSTTKFAVFGLSEALREELAPHRISVTAVCPGVINTSITTSTRRRGIFASAGASQQMIDLFRRRNYGPERVASNILKAVQRNRAVAPISPEAWMLYYLKRFTPSVLARINRAMGETMRRRLGNPS